jgi:hypothetical protein
MYNQEGGRANWQGQGLPQPSKTCECDEKPAEADKVPNADARISDKEMNKPKKKGGFQLNYDNLGEEIEAAKKKKKIKKMTPAQLEARKKKKPYRQDDLRRRKYREKKVKYISDLEEGGDGIYKPKINRGTTAAHGRKVARKRKKEQAENKIIDAMAMFDKAYRQLIKHKGLAGQKGKVEGKKRELFIGDLDEHGKVKETTRLANIHADRRRKRKLPPKTVNEHDSKIARGKVRHGMESLDKKLKALEDIIKKRRTRGRGGKKGKGSHHHTGKWRKTLTPLSGRVEATTPKDNAATAQNRAIAAQLGFLKPEPEKKIKPKELGKPSKTAPATGVKQFNKPKPKKIGNTTGSITAEQGDADAANTKKQKEENEKKAKESKKKKKGMSIFTKALLLAKYRGQKKETAAEKEKKKLEAKLSPEVEANMKRVDDLKDNVDALGRDKRTQHSTSEIGDGKKGTLKLITPQRKKLQRELLANEKKQKEKEKKLLEEENKKKKIKPKVKPKKSKFPKFGIKAEENQFGAWGQRGLGDGNGTGAIQGAGDTHLISPVKQKELDKLMAGARYMPRSVPRKKK